MKMRILLLTLTIVLLSTSCKEKKAEISNAPTPIDIKYNSIADTITYDVLIKNPNIHDTWAEKCVDDLDRRNLVDIIFDKIYKNRIAAYDIFTNKQLSIEEVKKIEDTEGFDRDKIAKFQFNEKWLFNAEEFKMRKEVYSIQIGYEVYNKEGEVRGYKPLFKIKLN